jgi:hypothetical protein
MMLTAILLGLAYMVFNEWLNVGIRRSWSYTEPIPFCRHSALVSPPFRDGWPFPAFAMT